MASKRKTKSVAKRKPTDKQPSGLVARIAKLEKFERQARAMFVGHGFDLPDI